MSVGQMLDRWLAFEARLKRQPITRVVDDHDTGDEDPYSPTPRQLSVGETVDAYIVQIATGTNCPERILRGEP